MAFAGIALRSVIGASLLLLAALLCGFTFRPGGPPQRHFEEYNARPPSGNTVTVCHGHGCQKQNRFTFTDGDIRSLATLMAFVRRSDTAREERRAIAHAVGWMERRVGPATGTANDRASLGFLNLGGQLDCVDEATNSTSYLMVLERNGLLRHHTVIRPYSKAGLFKWPHFAAMIRETATGREYAVDSGTGPNGTNPAILPAARWYIDDGGGEEPVPVRAAAPPSITPYSPSPQAASGGSSLGSLVERILREDVQPRPMALGYPAPQQ